MRTNIMNDLEWQRLCPLAGLSEDEPSAVRLGNEEVAVFRLGDRYFVTQNECTHGPGKLNEGYVEGEEIECPWHQGRFSILSGLPTAPPCTEALRTWETKVEGGELLVRARPKAS